MKTQILTLASSALFLSSAFSYVYAAPSVTAKENLTKLVATRSCEGCDLSGLNFNRMDLSKVNLEGADLSMSTFLLTDLSYANLKNTTLNGAVFGGADLGDADLTGADLRGVSLDSAYLGGTQMTGEIVTTKPYEDIGVDEVEKDVYVESQAVPKKAPTQKEVKVSQRRDLSEAPPAIHGADKKKDKVQPETQQQTARQQDVVQVSEGTPAVTAVPEAPPAKKSRMVQKATVPVAARQEVTSEPGGKSTVAVAGKVAEDEVSEEQTVAALKKSEPEMSQPIIKKPEIDIDKMNNLEQLLETNRCYGCDLSGLDLVREDLEDADLEQADLSGSNLEKADLDGANLKGALLVGANLRKANLNNADLYKADLTGADLTGARQKNVSFDGALLDDAIGLEMSLILQDQ